MERLDLKEELTLLLEKEIGFTGKFILEKQCQKLNIDPEKIDSAKLVPLAERISWAIRGYTGDKRAEEIKKGILEYRNALEIVDAAAKEKEDVADRIVAKLTIANKKMTVGMNSEAQAALKDAITLLEEEDFSGKDRLRVKVMRHLARALGRQKDTIEESDETYEKVIELGEMAGQNYDVALSWNGLGASAWRRGEHKRALECYNSALKSLEPMEAASKNEKERKKSAEATIKSGLGNVHLDLLNMEEAIQSHEEAIQLSKELENLSEVGRIYNNLARVYEEMKKYPKAIDNYERGIRYSRDAGMLRMEGWTLTNLASTLIENNLVNEALQHLERAGRVLADFKDPIAHSKLHCMWGKYYREKRMWDAGIDHFQRSVKYVKDENFPDYLATAEEEFGTLYQKMGEKKEAKALLESALAWFEKKEETNHIERIKGQLKELEN